MAFPVISTYRVQMRGRSNGFGFTFADAENLLDYLDDLGVSHLYLSPILTAVGGSTHGYDVTDPTTVSPELGGSDGLARLSAAARSRGMGLIVDIVPSHVGVGKPEQNAWWWDVLKFGRSSAYAEFFDIDWELGDGRIILPLLGSDSDVANLRVDGDLLRLGDLALPVAPGSVRSAAALWWIPAWLAMIVEVAVLGPQRRTHLKALAPAPFREFAHARRQLPMAD